MKLKSLLLGSVAAAGLSTGAFAADLSTVVSSFDICEQIGVDYGVAMSKDCVQISGNIEYEVNWGDYKGANPVTAALIWDAAARTTIDNNGTSPHELDWYSKIEWWVQFVGIASSDFGNAKAVIKLKNKEEYGVVNEGFNLAGTAPLAGTVTNANSTLVALNEAYVAVGDTTQLVAGRRDTSVFLDSDDEPFGFIGTFYSDAVDKGVNTLKDIVALKGHVIQLYHTLGDSGVTLSAGLEGINAAATSPTVALTDAVNASRAGTAVGTIAYAGDTFAGHASFAAGGILDGTVENWKMHAAGTATFDMFKVRGAFSAGNRNETIVAASYTEWNGLLSAQATFDMFTLAATIEGANKSAPALTQWGGNVTASAAVTDSVTVNAGFRWLDSDTTVANDTTYQAALQLVAKLTETLKATGEVGYYDVGSALPGVDTAYGSIELAWNPGGAFASSVKGEVTGIGGYKATFKASKKFE